MTSRSRTADPSPLCAPAYVSDAPTPLSMRVFPLILALLFLLLLLLNYKFIVFRLLVICFVYIIFRLLNFIFNLSIIFYYTFWSFSA